jgi:hypothetical protein
MKGVVVNGNEMEKLQPGMFIYPNTPGEGPSFRLN